MRASWAAAGRLRPDAVTQVVAAARRTSGAGPAAANLGRGMRSGRLRGIGGPRPPFQLDDALAQLLDGIGRIFAFSFESFVLALVETFQRICDALQLLASSGDGGDEQGQAGEERD